ncbi:MAG: hypothetical protein CMJ39_07550 [Phycisphaerae bacterium]|nr:hypothetical protein [Phycisphaerae bacterium]
MSAMPVSILLSRTVRLLIEPGAPVPSRGPNSFAASVSTPGLGAYFEVTIDCEGQPDEKTGFIENIYEIDRAVCSILAPMLAEGLMPPAGNPAAIIKQAIQPIQDHLEAKIHRLDCRLSPTYRIAMETNDMNSYLLTQQYQFAASHRLHNPELDESTNRALFGKCCNPNGHGHNYRMEVEVSLPIEGCSFTIQDLDQVVHETIIDRYDHTYLNMDVDDFKTINPTVENITVTCHDQLKPVLAEQGAKLRHIKLWETEKTCCTYPAQS